MKNLGKFNVKELDTETLKKMIGAKACELHEKHGFSKDDASYFVADCYLLINELKFREPDVPVKLI